MKIHLHKSRDILYRKIYLNNEILPNLPMNIPGRSDKLKK